MNKDKILENQVRLIIRENIKYLDNILEDNILKIFENENIIISDEDLMKDMIIIAKEVYFAG